MALFCVVCPMPMLQKGAYPRPLYIDANLYPRVKPAGRTASFHIPLPQGRSRPASSMSWNFAKLLLINIKPHADLWRS